MKLPTFAMCYLSEKAAYLRGLSEGLELDETTKEGKIIAKLLDLVEEMASSIEEINEIVEECEERVDDLEEFAEELSDCFSDCEHEGCSCGCEDDEDEEDDVEFYEVKCPHCSEKVYFDEDMIDSGDLVCPNCNEVIDIEIDE
ncbi:MAG: hypothetical protein E7393_00370 [Ruminococcaceae bacterium]|nr:hypothetical protein [Oscillospiraceae bacterium]